MKISELMSKNVVTAGTDETISSVLNKMRKYRINQLPVTDGKEFAGMIDIKTIVLRKLDPISAKVKGLEVSTPSISSSEDAEKAADLIIRTGVRAVPVIDKGKLVGIISETDIMKIFDVNGKVESVMTNCFYGEVGWNIGNVENILRDNNVSRVPILDKGKIVGVVSIIDMTKLIQTVGKMETIGSRKAATEKIRMEETPAESIMSKAITINKNVPLKEAAKILIDNEELFVEDDGSIFIVTPKDLIELMVQKPSKGVYVQILNIKDEPQSTADAIDKNVTNFIKLNGKKVSDPQALTVYVEKSHARGKRFQYSVRARFISASGIFVSHALSWDLPAAVKASMDKMEHEIDHKTGKRVARRKKFGRAG